MLPCVLLRGQPPATTRVGGELGRESSAPAVLIRPAPLLAWALSGTCQASPTVPSTTIWTCWPPYVSCTLSCRSATGVRAATAVVAGTAAACAGPLCPPTSGASQGCFGCGSAPSASQAAGSLVRFGRPSRSPVPCAGSHRTGRGGGARWQARSTAHQDVQGPVLLQPRRRGGMPRSISPPRTQGNLRPPAGPHTPPAPFCPVPSRQKPYDMHDVVNHVVDDGHTFEVQPDYAKNVLTAFARLGGEGAAELRGNPRASLVQLRGRGSAVSSGDAHAACM